MKLLTLSNTKILKGTKYGFLTAILHLSPAESSGVGNVCPSASKGCKTACLNTAGRGIFDRVQEARKRKTKLWFDNPIEFKKLLRKDIDWLIKHAALNKLVPCIRLNGTSDLPSLARGLAKEYTDVQFYDYTAIPRPYKRTLDNYHLTFSRKEDNMEECMDALKHHVNVAMVFETVPKTYLGFKVIDGDKTDLRFLDGKDKGGKALIVGLSAKGKAKKDQTGFVIRNNANH